MTDLLEAKALALPDELRRETTAVQNQVKAIAVIDADSYQLAIDLGSQIKTRIKAVKAFFAPLKVAADAAKKAVLDAEHKALQPLLDGEIHLSTQATAWRRAQQIKADTERHKAEEAERARIEEARKKEVADLRVQGKEKTAAALESAPIEAPKVQVAQSVPKVRNIRKITAWRFTIVDRDKLPREYMTPDLQKIGEYVRMMKGEASIPGVEIFSEESTVFL